MLIAHIYKPFTKYYEHQLQLYNNHPDNAYRWFTNQLLTIDTVLTIYQINVYANLGITVLGLGT